MARKSIYVVSGMIMCAIMAYNGHTEGRQEETQMAMEKEYIRPAMCAGSWYEGNPERLRRTIESYLESAETTTGLGTIIGMIAPHAGYIYSGPVAGYAFKAIRGERYDTVIVIAPNHTDPRLHFSSVLTRGGYETPLGVIPVDVETARAIVDYSTSDSVRDSDLVHLTEYGGRYEHSLEIELPFLQVALGDFKFVPIVMGDQDNGERSCPELAAAIVHAVEGKKALLVASSDLSHFYQVDTLKKMDNVIKEHVEGFDVNGLRDDLARGRCEACGGLPIMTVMIASSKLGAEKATVLAMANSGDVSGDYQRPVGYMAAVFGAPLQKVALKEQKSSQAQDVAVGVDLGVTEEDKTILRNVVKNTLEVVVNGGAVPQYNNHNGILGEEWGAFVTLNKKGQLRGCIGHIIGDRPLINTVAEMARAAALQDPRFPPVKPSELPDIEFEISVLTPIRTIDDIEEIIVGRDGIIITRGMNRGLLLPQVATEYGWDRTTFLEHTCVKAGLPRNAWSDEGTVIEIFSAEVF